MSFARMASVERLRYVIRNYITAYEDNPYYSISIHWYSYI